MIASEREVESAVDAWLRENGGSFRYEHVAVKRNSRGWVVVLAGLRPGRI
jgi:hypothetical protein